MEARRAATEETKAKGGGSPGWKERGVGGFLGPDQKGVPVLVTWVGRSEGGREGGREGE